MLLCEYIEYTKKTHRKMAINLGGEEVNTLYLGSETVSAIYLGGQQVL